MSDALMTIDELAKLIRKSPSSISSDLSRNPTALPPAIRLPGTRRVLFDPVAVKDWVLRHTSAPTTPADPVQAKRRGRPTKAEQIARQRRIGGGQ